LTKRSNGVIFKERGDKVRENMCKKIKDKYVGKWIGIIDNKVIATSQNHRELYKILKQKETDGVYVFYSPTKEERKHGFLF